MEHFSRDGEKEHNKKDGTYPFSKDDIATFEERRNKRLNRESKIYSLEEAKAIITSKETNRPFA